ncbi:MAG: putative RNA-binding protein (virulence factor B family) [Myxococcota bacterium]|jgi:predicted RNA-binding protein (virulence factor B family)
MIAAGTTHRLTVRLQDKLGYLLGNDDGDGDVAHLPFRAAPHRLVPGQEIEVFVYIDSDAKVVATTATPTASVGDYTVLEVVDIGEHGAFLDWGLEKDLFVPNRLQQVPMAIGRSYVVHVFRDDRTGRATAASQLREYLDYDPSGINVGDEVEALVYGRNDVGWLAVVDRRYAGIIYANEIFRDITISSTHKAWVREIRSSNKIDLSLQRLGHRAIGDDLQRLRQALIAAGGSLALHDRSPPEAIAAALGISKKAFKRARGGLLKAGEIEPLRDETRLKGTPPQ